MESNPSGQLSTNGESFTMKDNIIYLRQQIDTMNGKLDRNHEAFLKQPALCLAECDKKYANKKFVNTVVGFCTGIFGFIFYILFGKP